MVVPKFSYVTGLVLQIVAYVFILIEHNILGAILILFIGDFQMLVTIGFSRLKNSKLFTYVDFSIFNFNFIVQVIIYFNFLFSVSWEFIPEVYSVLVILTLPYFCFRSIFPLINLKRSKYSSFYFNGILILWLFTLWSYLNQYVLPTFLNQFNLSIIFILIATMGASIVISRLLLKSFKAYEGSGCCIIIIIALEILILTTETSFIALNFLFSLSNYILILLMLTIWALIINFLILGQDRLRGKEKHEEGYFFVLLFYFVFQLLILEIFLIIIETFELV